MKVLRLIAKAIATFLLASVALIIVTAQFAPGWKPAGAAPAISPRPGPKAVTVPALDIVQTSASVGEGHTRLPAWVVQPRDGVHPGVVLVPGAGEADRDSLLAEARVLAAAGIACILVEKRSAGYSFFSRDYAALADDAIAARKVLKALPGVDPERIGIMGWSEGGWVAPLAVQRAPGQFAFMVVASASVVSPLEQIAWTVDNAIAGAPGWLRRVPATALGAGRPFVDYLDFDVRPALADVAVPVYAVWGADDATVPVREAASRLTSGLRTPVEVHVIPGAGHFLPPQHQGWLPATAVWMAHPSATSGSYGVEPQSGRAVPGVPENTWFTNPLYQSAVSVLVSAAVVFRSIRRGTLREVA